MFCLSSSDQIKNQIKYFHCELIIIISQGRPTQPESAANSLRQLREKVERGILREVPPTAVQLVEKISEGGYGTVNVARVLVPAYSQTEVESRLCVVKYMASTTDDQEREDFVKEVQLLSGLEDENISRVLGLGNTSLPHFVVMEYLEHGDLTQFLQSHLPEDTPYMISNTKTLSFPTLLYMATQVASGMKYLESLNFVHRDLATR